jgi:hypothetical protein
MRKVPWVLAAMAFSFPAAATTINVDIQSIYTNNTSVLCEPCGPSSITYDYQGGKLDFTFGWFGGAGLAHDALANAFATFDASASWDGLDPWLADNPDGIVFQREDDGVSSLLIASVVRAGEFVSTLEDMVRIGDTDGYWLTGYDGDETYHAYFTSSPAGAGAPAPAPVPEPGTISLLAIALAAAARRSIFA